jgi:restriction system protein
MNVIGWLILVGGAIWLIFIAAGWLLTNFGAFIKGMLDTFEMVAQSVLDFLGKKRLIQSYEAPHDLLDLEAKIATEDFEKNQLKKYAPPDCRPASLEKAKYEEKIPQLYRKTSPAISIDINIADVRGLTTLGAFPAYQSLIVVSEADPPKFPFPRLSGPSVESPCEWTRWSCNETTYELTYPAYSGALKPFNFFVQRSFKKATERAESLRLRQKVALGKAHLRNTEMEILYQEAKVKFEDAKNKQQAIWLDVEAREKLRRDAFFLAYNNEKQELDRLVAAAKSDAPDGLVARVEQTLKLENFPYFLPAEFAVRFDEASRILILEHQFPDVGGIRWIKTVNLKSGVTVKPANQKEAKEAATLLYPALSLRLACEISRLDNANLLEAVVINGWSNYTEKSTGQVRRAYCTSLFATKDQLLGINLSAADPLAAFAALKGVSARSLELTPIAPILRLNTEDKRFVDAKEVLGNMEQGENLAAMNWEDFEHLCRQLFEKAFAGSGAEVKVTQASRDQGVDAVIFDPDVLRGGKIVVQAKRYTNIVDVSAVRDLYGAVINEGATKGILVTTSHYGPDAYGFAKDKPITLLNGEELLGLLQKYGYSFRIDLSEAKRLNADANLLR